MAKASEAKKDDEVIRQAAEAFKKHGVKQQEGKSAEPPKPDRDSFEQRARVRDLSQDQGKRPEGVHQQAGWADRVIASRANAPSQGMSRGGASNDIQPRESQKSATKGAANDTGQAAAKASGPTSWAERVIASRPAGYGHGKVEGQENAAEKGKVQEAKPQAPEKEKQKEARPKEAKTQSAAKGQGNSQPKAQENGQER